MSQETLFTAARRVVREFNIVMSDGGLVNERLERAFDILTVQINIERNQQKKLEKQIANSSR